MKKLFSHIKRLWLLFAQKLGKFNTIVLLSFVYIIIIGCMSLVMRIFRKDPLRKSMDPKLTTYWQIKETGEQTLDRHKFQF